MIDIDINKIYKKIKGNISPVFRESEKKHKKKNKPKEDLSYLRSNITIKLNDIEKEYIKQAQGYYLWEIGNMRNYSKDDIRTLSEKYNIESKMSFKVIEWSKEFNLLSEEGNILIELIFKKLGKELNEKNSDTVFNELVSKYKKEAEKEVEKWCDEYDRTKKQ